MSWVTSGPVSMWVFPVLLGAGAFLAWIQFRIENGSFDSRLKAAEGKHAAALALATQEAKARAQPSLGTQPERLVPKSISGNVTIARRPGSWFPETQVELDAIVFDITNAIPSAIDPVIDRAFAAAEERAKAKERAAAESGLAASTKERIQRTATEGIDASVERGVAAAALARATETNATLKDALWSAINAFGGPYPEGSYEREVFEEMVAAVQRAEDPIP